MKIIDNQTMCDEDFLKIRKNNMISLAALIIITKMIYSQLFKFIMRDEDFFIINVTIYKIIMRQLPASAFSTRT